LLTRVGTVRNAPPLNVGAAPGLLDANAVIASTLSKRELRRPATVHAIDEAEGGGTTIACTKRQPLAASIARLYGPPLDLGLKGNSVQKGIGQTWHSAPTPSSTYGRRCIPGGALARSIVFLGYVLVHFPAQQDASRYNSGVLHNKNAGAQQVPVK
jgi:hypothetical protein